jgi:hypothetical protein
MRPLLAAAVLLLAGCSGSASRIKRQKELFSSFPPEAQAKIREGKVELGFTPEMVAMAWGAPDRKSKSTTAAGEDEVWSYGGERRGGRSGVSGSVGYGGSSGSGGVLGVGLGIGVGGRGGSEHLRQAIFHAGKVVRIEE